MPSYAKLLDSEHPLELLSHLHSLVVLLLTHFPGIKELLDLLLGIAAKILPELLKTLKHSAALVTLHVVVQLVHPVLLSNVPLFAPFLPSERPFPVLWHNRPQAERRLHYGPSDRVWYSQALSC